MTGKQKGGELPARPFVIAVIDQIISDHSDREKQAAERDGADKAGQFLHVSFLLLAAQPNGRVVPWKASIMFSYGAHIALQFINSSH